MEVVRDEQPEWLTNSYLVYDRPGGTGFLIDANGRTAGLLEKARAEGVTVEHLLLTHEHWDHAVDARALAEGEGLTVHAHPGAAGALAEQQAPIGQEAATPGVLQAARQHAPAKGAALAALRLGLGLGDGGRGEQRGEQGAARQRHGGFHLGRVTDGDDL